MPEPIAVRLRDHDPAWLQRAAEEGSRMMAHVAATLRADHVGSTSVPGLLAKPVLDLTPLVSSLAAADLGRTELEAIGYAWHGEYGIEGRRYCTRDDPANGERTVQLHIFAEGDPHIQRYLLFRDMLRSDPALARGYWLEKGRCAALYPEDSHAYSDCKAAWIESAVRRIGDHC